MYDPPAPPVDVAVNGVGQAIMTIGVAIGVAIVVVSAVRLGRRWSTPAAVLIPVSTLLAACMMPMPDAIASAWYFLPGQMTLWTTFGVSLPVWTFFSYVAFYGGFGLLFWYRSERGDTRKQMVRAMAGMWVFALATEIAGIQLGTYTYYTDQPFRVAGFPVWVSLCNVGICAGIGIGSARLRRWLPTRELVGPALFLGPAVVVVGLFFTTFPMLQVSHTVEPSTWALYAAAVASLVLAATMCYFATRFIPVDGLTPIDDRRDAPESAASVPRQTA
jgi:hypothetical protein